MDERERPDDANGIAVFTALADRMHGRLDTRQDPFYYHPMALTKFLRRRF
jgi:hypothetical protein